MNSIHALMAVQPGATPRTVFATRMSRTLLAMMTMLIAAVPYRASAQSLPPAPSSASCYTVIAAQPGVQPAILLDSCSGRSWQLIAMHRNGASERRRSNARYVWSPIGRDEDEAAHSAMPASDAPPASVGGEPPKCFQFDGRRFCE